MSFSEEDKKFMKLALEEAKKAFKKGDAPIGAVLVANGKVIGKSANEQNTQNNWTSHAEMMVLTKNATTIKKKSKK